MRMILASLGALAAVGALGFVPLNAQPLDDDVATLETRFWTAWVEDAPSGPQTLHVTGEVVLPHDNFDVDLEASESQRSDPAILMLELDVKELAGLHADVAEEREVGFEISPYEGGYGEVSILHEGKEIAHIDAIGASPGSLP